MGDFVKLFKVAMVVMLVVIITALHYGCDIHAASEGDKGATFTVTIPRESSGKPFAIDPFAKAI